MSLNRVTISGRLSRDLELRRTQSGTAIASFTLAVDGDFKDKQTGERPTYWIDCVAWNTTAEFMSRYLNTKGRIVVLDGRLQTRTWTDKDGNRRKSTEVIAEHVYFGDSKRDDSSYDSGGYGQDRGYSDPQPSAPPDPFSGYSTPLSDGDQFSALSTEDGNLPF